MAGAAREPVKVIIIDTKFVETDLRSFKSVVQSLTGKDSGVAWTEQAPYVGQKRKRLHQEADERPADGNSNGGCSPLLLDKELDWLLMGLPLVEDVKWLWSE